MTDVVTAVRTHTRDLEVAEAVARRLAPNRRLGAAMIGPECITFGAMPEGGRWVQVSAAADGIRVDVYSVARVPNGLSMWIVPTAEVIAAAAFLGRGIMKLIALRGGG